MRSVWQLIATLVIVAILMRVIPWLILAAIVGAAIWAVRALILADVDRRKLEAARRDGLIARCDQQHRQVLRGDPEGTYGNVVGVV